MPDLISILPVITTALLGIIALFKDYKHDRTGNEVRWLSKSGMAMLILILVTMGGSIHALSKDKEENTHLMKEVTLTRTEIKSQIKEEMLELRGVLIATGQAKLPDNSILNDPRLHTTTRGGDLSYKTLNMEAVTKEYLRLKAEVDASENGR